MKIALCGGSGTQVLARPGGVAHIKWTLNRSTEYVSNPAGAWVTDTTAAPGAMALARDGALYTVGLAVRTNRSGEWVDVGRNDWRCNRIAIDDSNGVHLGRFPEDAPDTLTYVSGDAAAPFTAEPVVTGRTTILGAQLSVTADSAVHFVFDNADVGVSHATKVGGEFVETTLPDSVRLITMAVAPESGVVHVLQDGSFEGLIYSNNASGTFESRVLEARFSDGRAAIAVSELGGVEIAYAGVFEGARRVRQISLCP